MLKRIIQTQPQVSPLALEISKHEETEEDQPELPSKRISSMVEMQLPNLVPEETSVAPFRMAEKRKKLSISEFERAADKRLPQNKAQSTLDSTALARSLRLSLGSLIPPDTVEKRGLLRRPKHRKAIDIEAFEGRVEQNMLKRKAQDCLVGSQTASGIQTAMLTSDAEIMLNNTELFIQPQFEQSQNKLSALEPQLSDSKTSAKRSKISDAAQEEARLVDLVSRVGTNEGRTQRYSEDLTLDGEDVDRMTQVSPKPPANQQEDEQDHSQQSNPVEQLSVSEQVVAGTVNRWSSFLPSRRSSSKSLGSPVTLKLKRSFSMSLREVVSHIIEDLDVSDAEEMANTVNRVEQEEIFREGAEHCAHVGYSENLEKELTEKSESQVAAAQGARVKMEITPSEEEGVAEGGAEHQGSSKAEHRIAEGVGAGSLGSHTQVFSFFEKSGMKLLKEAVEEADELEDQATMVKLDGLEDEPSEDEEDPESEEVSMKTPTFVHTAAYKPLLSTPRPTKPAAAKLSPPCPAKPAALRSPLQPLQAKPAPKNLGASRRKMREPEVASSLIKKIFSHYVKMPVARDAFKIVEKCSKRYFKQLSSDLEAYSSHAGRKTVEKADLEVLMRRQGLVTDKMPLNVLIEHHLPLEYRRLLIPVAVSGNKVLPHK
ncbi:PREDICTED: LOW QUALITY PROTEIN: centromere protein T [Leptosomus discolor]|uniref:LOW QUALITY PROTEIN: centromere protein T n=1 Tax=Leptosomus discolor TaxID=188344 RepID=UPI00052267A2|nr:PREDICTED: LOW QUALITY PROTEIN: centromere protein T [Leptosomus discolor]